MDGIGVYIIAGIIVAFIMILLLIQFIEWCQWFMKELRYLNNEINRTTGAERRHYLKRKKRLLLSLIPFVRY